MAMPTDGQSSWVHSADVYLLPRADGTPWALVTWELAPRVQLGFAADTSGTTFSTALGLSVARLDEVTWCLRHPSFGEQRRAWRSDTQPDALVATGRVAWGQGAATGVRDWPRWSTPVAASASRSPCPAISAPARTPRSPCPARELPRCS
jgi:hypothetical protein